MPIANLFDNANLYKIFQFAVSRQNTFSVIRQEVLKPEGVQDVLDFGCGIGYHSFKLFLVSIILSTKN